MKIFLILFTITYYTNAQTNFRTLKNSNITNNSINIIEYQFPKIDYSKFEHINKHKLKDDKLLGVDDEDFEEKIKLQILNRFNAIHPDVKNGISFSLINSKTGQINYSVGHSDKFNNTPLSTEMPLQIASITKVYTAALIFKLQDQGKLSIQDEISKYIDPIPNVNMSLKIQNLLNHSSQIYDFFNRNIDLLFATYLSPEIVPELDFILQNLRPHQFPQDVQNEYSNTNYILLAKIIENASGLTFEEYLEQIILEPLGLENTYFVGKNIQEPNNIAAGWFEDKYNYIGISKVNDSDLSKLYESSFGMGNIVATPSDVAKFGYELMKGNIISTEAVNQMTQQFSFDEQSNTAYGNGIFYTKLGELDCYNHSGSLFGYQSYLWMIPELDICFVINMNSGSASFGYNNTAFSDLLESILFEIFDITKQNPFNTELANVSIFEEIKDNIIDYGETIEVEFSLRDISKRFDVMFANFKLTGELHKIEDLSSVIIDTLFSDGYSYFTQRLKFKVKDNIESDNIYLAIQIDDITGEYDLINLPFNIPLNKNQKSLEFGGYENRIEIPANTFNLEGAWTLEMDFNMLGLGKQMGNQRLQALFYNSQTLGILIVDGMLAITLFTENGSNPIYVLPSPIEQNKWNHLAVSYDGVNSLKVYLDGTNVTMTNINSQQPGGQIVQEIPPRLCTIGNGPNKISAQFPFEGSIDNVRLWNKELNISEINKVITQENNNSIYFAYDFNEGFGLNIKDIVGQRNGIRFSKFYQQAEEISSVEKRKNNNTLKIYPIPATNNLTIESKDKLIELALFDLAGNKVFQKKMNFEEQTKIDITDLPKGTYVLLCKTDSGEITKKIIK